MSRPCGGGVGAGGGGRRSAGLVVCGLGKDGLAYVLGDHSVSGLTPEGWAREVAAAAEAWGANRVVAETNRGGEMVESNATPTAPMRWSGR